MADNDRYISPHAKPTPYQRELLDCLIEEAAEVIKAATKLMRFGAEDSDPNPPPFHDKMTNKQALSNEFGQMQAIWSLLISTKLVGLDHVGIGYRNKLAKLPKFLQSDED